jgi:anti-sigma B factor antagonist
VAFSDFHPSYITVVAEGEIALITFTLPSITEEENVELLGQELYALFEKYDYQKLAVNLEGVRYVTSAAVGKLISLHRKLHRLGGMLVICNIGERVAEVLRTSRLIDYFHVADDVDGAIAMLRRER